MFGFLLSPIGKWLGVGLIASIVVGGAIFWHKSTFVHIAELRQWQEYTTNLSKAYSRREAILRKYQDQVEIDEKKLEQMEKELNEWLVQDSLGDNPIVLDSDDVKRLRDFIQGHDPS